MNVQQGGAVHSHPEEAEILFVDLDGSLVATDLLWEHLFAMLKGNLWLIVLVPIWLLKGKSGLKTEVSRRVDAAPESLPYNPALLELLLARRESGTRLVLATASPRPWAEAVAQHLGLFDAVLATDPGRNLKGKGKLVAIQEYCRDRGTDRFGYVGDSDADLPIWRASASALIVRPSRSLTRRLESFGPSVTVEAVGKPRKPIRAALKALRPHQWAKNALIFVPLITGQRFGDPASVLAATLAAIAFSLCASAIYLINDLVDLEADRAHSEKRRRPFASGNLPLSWGPPIAFACLVIAFGLSIATLPAAFVATLALYLVLTTAYSFVIKSRLMADVLLLAGLYSIRIFAGGTATGIPISEWLIGFSMFLFLSLAFVKRYIELDRAPSVPETQGSVNLKGRGYRPSDISMIESVGPTSGYLAILVLALYIQSAEVQQLYQNPSWLWPICLVLVYWISRIWFLAKRGELPGDPVIFALKDRHSLVLGVIVVCCLAAGILIAPGS